MNDQMSRDVKADAGIRLSQLSWMGSYVPVAGVLITALWITLGAISKSQLIGRLADPMTHNDVNYVIDGIRRLIFIELNGIWSELLHLYLDPMHAPLSAYQASLGFYLFGFHDWAPYASNIIYLVIFLGVCVALLRCTPSLVVIAGLAATAGLPLAYTTISEFAPEIPLSLFTALGVLLTFRISSFDRAIGARIVAGLCFGVGMLAKPSSFVFVPLVVCATLGTAFLHEVFLENNPGKWKQAIAPSALHVILSLWLPALYVIPNFAYYSDYFYTALFDIENVKAYGGNLDVGWHLRYYTVGWAGEYMFGNFVWKYVGIIAMGMAAASVRGDRPFIARQIELLVMVIFLWLLPTVSVAKNTLLAAPFGYLLWFMVILGFRSIFETLRGIAGIAVVGLLSFLLLTSGTARFVLANVPGFDWDTVGAHIIREKWPEAQDRFRAVMLGNSPNYYGRSVYMTNVGYYHVPTLWYWFLKKDPSLDWTFGALWQDSNPQHHLDFFHQRRVDFVIAGENGNGLTFGLTLIPGAAAVEDTVLAALWDDPTYMAVDRFYGPTGRTITVFQRRAAFGGWRPLSGLAQPGTTRPWISSGTISHLEAYAPDAVPAQLVIEANGPAGATIEVIANKERIGQLTFDGKGNASWTQTFNLVSGENDLIFHYATDAPVEFRRLLVIRKLDRQTGS